MMTLEHTKASNEFNAMFETHKTYAQLDIDLMEATTFICKAFKAYEAKQVGDFNTPRSDDIIAAKNWAKTKTDKLPVVVYLTMVSVCYLIPPSEYDYAIASLCAQGLGYTIFN